MFMFPASSFLPAAVQHPTRNIGLYEGRGIKTDGKSVIYKFKCSNKERILNSEINCVQTTEDLSPQTSLYKNSLKVVSEMRMGHSKLLPMTHVTH